VAYSWRASITLASLVWIAVLPIGAMAQSQSPARLGIEAGATVPVSDYASDKRTGYHLGLLIDVRTPQPPLGFRFEGAFHELRYSGNSTKAQIWAVTANVMLKVPNPTPLRPYVIGGAGFYNSHQTLFLAATKSSTDLGINGGAGMRLELHDVTAFVEARYHKVSGGGPRLAPITIGLLF
jgi:hypothetical protein